MIKKDCVDAHRQVYEYLDGEIGWYRRWKIRRHLRRCPPCQDGFDFEDELKERIRAGCSEEVPRELFERLRASLRRENDTEDPVG